MLPKKQINIFDQKPKPLVPTRWGGVGCLANGSSIPKSVSLKRRNFKASLCNKNLPKFGGDGVFIELGVGTCVGYYLDICRLKGCWTNCRLNVGLANLIRACSSFVGKPFQNFQIIFCSPVLNLYISLFCWYYDLKYEFVVYLLYNTSTISDIIWLCATNTHNFIYFCFSI